MTVIELISAIGIGIVSGIASGLMGIGGAMLTTPGLRLVLGVDANIAIGTPLLVVIPTAIAGGLRYARSRHVNFRVVSPTAVVGSVSAVGGALTTKFVAPEIVLIATGAFVIISAARIMWSNDVPSRVNPHAMIATAAIIGLVSGFFSGFLGLGGGVILVPAFMWLLAMPLKQALGTSLVVVALQAIPGSVVHAFLGNIDFTLAGLLLVGTIPGARLGSWIAVRTSQRPLRIIVATALMAVGIVLAISEVSLLRRPLFLVKPAQSQTKNLGGVSVDLSFEESYFGPGRPFTFSGSINNPTERSTGPIIANVRVFRKSIGRSQLEDALEEPTGSPIASRDIAIAPVGGGGIAPFTAIADFLDDPGFRQMDSGVYPVEVTFKDVSDPTKILRGGQVVVGSVFLNAAVELPVNLVVVAQFAPRPPLGASESALSVGSDFTRTLDAPLPPSFYSSVPHALVDQLEFMALTDESAASALKTITNWSAQSIRARIPLRHSRLVGLDESLVTSLFESTTGELVVAPDGALDREALNAASKLDACCVLLNSDQLQGSSRLTVSTPALYEDVLVISRDKQLSRHASGANNSIAQQNLRARLAMLYFERPGVSRTLGLEIDALRTSSRQIVGLLERLPWIKLGGLPTESGDAGVTFNQDIPVQSDPTGSVIEAKNSVTRLRKWVFENNDVATRLGLIVNALESTAFPRTNALTTQEAREVTQTVKAAEEAITTDTSGGVTFTSLEGEIPLTIQNGNDFPVRVRVELSGGQVRFPDGNSRTLTVEPPGASLTIPAVAAGSGTFVLNALVTSEDGNIVLNRGELLVTSTAANRLALFVTLAAFGVLVIGYVRRKRRNSP